MGDSIDEIRSIISFVTSRYIDAARNPAGDFTPFHGQKKWNRISGNPFGMPIVLW